MYIIPMPNTIHTQYNTVVLLLLNYYYVLSHGTHRGTPPNFLGKTDIDPFSGGRKNTAFLSFFSFLEDELERSGRLDENVIKARLKHTQVMDVIESIPLTEQTIELWNAYTLYRRARDKFIRENMLLVGYYAKAYMGRVDNVDDVIQEGYKGLIDAIDKFDPNLGNKLSTYATFAIRDAMSRFVKEQCSVVLISTHATRMFRLIGDAVNTLSNKFDRHPTTAEISVEIGIPEKAVVQFMTLNTGTTDITEVIEQEYFLEEDSSEPVAKDKLLILALSELPSRDKFILEARFGFGGEILTLQQISDVLHISRERVRQLEVMALKRITAVCAAVGLKK